jgi:hypothetical protein
MLYSPGSSSGGGSSSRWQPSMSRIRSGHDLQLLDADESEAAGQQSAVWPAGMSLQDAPTAGEATESLGHGKLMEGLQQIEQVGLRVWQQHAQEQACLQETWLAGAYMHQARAL